MLTDEQIRAYNEVRIKHARGILCHAPFVSLNFEQNGNVSACCYNRSFSLGKIPNQTINEIWSGKKADQLRKYIQQNDLSGGCSACQEVIQFGNYQGTKAIYYDEFAPRKTLWQKLKSLWGNDQHLLMPKVFEFELSNSCNLECTMCNGYFSSAIRKNREKLPPIKNHYGEDFVEQLIPFLPYLTDAKFLGGEPFLIDIYFKIWDKIIEINPNIRIHITTNGTIVNKKTKKYLEKLNAGIILSIDSLNKVNYEKIRQNANYDMVIENIQYFINYTKEKNTFLSFAICPIISNKFDIPEIMHFCNQNNIHIHFNTVWTPENESLRFLSSQELKAIIEYYKKEKYITTNNLQIENLNKLNDFISQLENWYSEKLNNETKEDSIYKWQELLLSLNIENDNSSPILTLEKNYYQNYNSISTETHINKLKQLKYSLGTEVFLSQYISSMNYLAKYANEFIDFKLFASKTEAFSQFVMSLQNKESLAEELIRTGFVFQMDFFLSHEKDHIISLAKNRFV